MKLVDQYVESVGRHIYGKSKKEMMKEIKANVLDDIEATCGLDASDEEAFERIKSFGTPRELAKSYTNQKAVIDEGLTDLYFMILKIVLLALTIAFVTVYFVDVIIAGSNPVREALYVPLNVVSSYTGAVGVITLIFMGISRSDKVKSVDLDEDWDLNELRCVELGNKKESRLGSAIAIAFLFIFAAIVVLMPEKILAVEEGFMIAGIIESYSMNVDVFRGYALFVVAAILFEIIYHTLVIVKGEKSRKIRWFEMCSCVYTVVLFGIMLLDGNLFINNGFFINVRMIFAIIFAVTLIELVVSLYQMIRLRSQISEY